MTSKRARHVSSKGTVWHMSSEQATLAKMPKYNGYACGYGAHGNAKYHRAKSKRAWKAQMQKEGASQGSFLLWAMCCGGAALMVALPHIDILDKLASLVNIHLLINMANVGIHGMGRYHQLVCNVRCGVSSSDKLKDFAFAL